MKLGNNILTQIEERRNQNTTSSSSISSIVTFICTQKSSSFPFEHFNFSCCSASSCNALSARRIPSTQFLVPSCRSKFPFIHYLPLTKNFLRLYLCSRRRKKNHHNIFLYTHRQSGRSKDRPFEKHKIMENAAKGGAGKFKALLTFLKSSSLLCRISFNYLHADREPTIHLTSSWNALRYLFCCFCE